MYGLLWSCIYEEDEWIRRLQLGRKDIIWGISLQACFGALFASDAGHRGVVQWAHQQILLEYFQLRLTGDLGFFCFRVALACRTSRFYWLAAFSWSFQNTGAEPFLFPCIIFLLQTTFWVFLGPQSQQDKHKTQASQLAKTNVVRYVRGRRVWGTKGKCGKCSQTRKEQTYCFASRVTLYPPHQVKFKHYHFKLMVDFIILCFISPIICAVLDFVQNSKFRIIYCLILGKQSIYYHSIGVCQTILQKVTWSQSIFAVALSILHWVCTMPSVCGFLKRHRVTLESFLFSIFTETECCWNPLNSKTWRDISCWRSQSKLCGHQIDQIAQMAKFCLGKTKNDAQLARGKLLFPPFQNVFATCIGNVFQRENPATICSFQRSALRKKRAFTGGCILGDNDDRLE